jgi:hypothetical protein
MISRQDGSLKAEIRRVLVEEVPEASEEHVERATERILKAVDPFEKAAGDVLLRYDRTFSDLAK